MNEITQKKDEHNVQSAAARLECLRIRFELVSALGFIVSRPKESRDLFGDKNFEELSVIFEHTYIYD